MTDISKRMGLGIDRRCSFLELLKDYLLAVDLVLEQFAFIFLLGLTMLLAKPFELLGLALDQPLVFVEVLDHLVGD